MNKLHKAASWIKSKLIDPVIQFLKDQYEYRFRELTLEDVFFFDHDYTRFFASQIEWFFENSIFTKSNIKDGLIGVFFKDVTVLDTKRAGLQVRVLVAINKLPLNSEMFSEPPASRQRYIVEINFITINQEYQVYPSILSSNLSLNELFGIFLSDQSLSQYLNTYFETSTALNNIKIEPKTA